jgi:isoleucyl-tRNA synthetase
VNQALAYGPEVEYIHLNIVDHPSGVEAMLVARELYDAFASRVGLPGIAAGTNDAGVSVEYDRVIKGSDLAGTIARHPMHHLGGFFAKPRPFLPGDFVTTDSGTGLVHMAPDHGEDDFILCKEHGIEPVFAVEGDGKYRADWLWLGGQGSVINGKFNAPDGPICEDLKLTGGLLSAAQNYPHSYPHSWRSKAKVIYRCTPQWFVPMDKPLAALEFPVAPGGTIEVAIAKAQAL